MKLESPKNPRPHQDRRGPQHPESSETAELNITLRGDKDDWLWAYPDELDPTRPADEELLSE
jgi:hypothetical protein